MGLFSRKKEVKSENIPRLPELPELPESLQPALLPKSEVPDVPEGLPKIETQVLPALPDSEIRKKFNQEAIKHEISKPGQEFQKSKFEPLAKTDLEAKKTLELPTPTTTPFPKAKKLTKKVEPVFIRLDKFQATAEIFEEIKIKIEEIEELLGKTREIKIKEEQELVEWEREIQMIKSRIDLIDKNIFNKLD